MERILVFTLLTILLLGCSKQTEFQDSDEEFLITHRDFTEYQNFEEFPFKNGFPYFYSYKINPRFGLYSFYSIFLRNPDNNNEIKWSVKANKFFKSEDIDRLFNSSSQMKLLYKNDVVPFEAERFNAEQGFCINNREYFQFVIMKDNIMLDLTIEGYHNMNLDMVDSVIENHLVNLSNISLDEARESTTKKLL